MSSPGSESSWCMVDPREHRQQMEAAVDKQAMLYQQAQMASSAANLSHVRRLGTARTHVAMDDPDPMPPLIATVPISAPAPTPGAIPFGSKKHAPRDFPRTEEKVEREPPKGQSFTRKLKTSLLGGKNPFLASNKAHEKEKDRKEAIVIPPPLSPEPDAVVVRRPGSESNGSTPELVAPAPTSSSRGARPPPVTYSRDLYSVQPPQHQPQRRRGSSAAPPEPTNEPPKSEISLRRSREVLIVEVAGKRAGDVSIEREPVLGALQTHRRSPGKAMFAQPTQHAQPGQPTHPVQHAHPVQPTHPTQPTRSTHPTQPAQSAPAPASAHAPAPGASPSTIRPLPPAPVPVQSTPPRPLPAPGPSRVVVRPVAPLTRPSQESLHPGAHYRDSQSSQQTSSSPPVVRYKTSMDRTSYATSTTTPSLGSSVKTHASQAVSDPPRKDPPNRDTPSKALPNRDPPTRSPPSKDPPSNDPPSKDMERIQWAAAPPSRPPNPDPAPVVVREQPDEAGAWSESMAQLTLRANKQPGYHMEMSSKYEKPQETTPPPTQEPKAKPRKLQRHPTTAATTATTYYYYDSSPPLITRVSRLSELKEDYRNPGSERSNIIRRKINYLRFELGFTGLRRARGDGNCFYRSFAFSYLEQILFAEDRALAVVNALEQLEMAQNLIDVAIPGHRFSQQMHLYLRDVIRNMELGKTDQKRLLHIFQDQRDSDDIVAYVRLLASAYIRLTPETHASVFHPDDPMTVITPSDFCSIYVEQLGQDAGESRSHHLQISALSRTLNVSVYIYRLDEKLDGESAPNEQDLPAHCTRFVPSELSPVTEPVFLLFRPGHYDILERHTNY